MFPDAVIIIISFFCFIIWGGGMRCVYLVIPECLLVQARFHFIHFS